MSVWRRPAVGLLGRIFSILLLMTLFEFGASTVLYERASEVSVRQDEAHRLAEHLVIARKLMEERPPRGRPAIAIDLTTDRYRVGWTLLPPATSVLTPQMNELRRQVIAWEPSLGDADLHIRLTSLGRGGVAAGSLRLRDGSWLGFSTTEPPHGWSLAIGRIASALVPAVGFILIGGILLRRTLRPLRAIARAADELGHGGGGGAVLTETGPAEVRQLVVAFNEMQGRIRRLIDERTEALAAVGHDLRTPLARLQLRLDGVPDAAVKRALAGDLDEMGAMISSLMDYLAGEDDPEKPVAIDLAVLLATLADDAEDRGFAAAYDGPDHHEAAVRPSGFKRALSNLVENALHYAGVVELALAIDAGSIVMRIEDRGPGVPEDRLGEIMRPFARLDPARSRNTSGLGLGLAIAARAVAREGGDLTLANRPGGGLSARITLPLSAQSAVPRAG